MGTNNYGNYIIMNKRNYRYDIQSCALHNHLNDLPPYGYLNMILMHSNPLSHKG